MVTVINLFREIADAVNRGEGLSFETTEYLLDGLIDYANEETTLAGMGLGKQHIQTELKQCRDISIFKAWETLDMDMDELLKLVENLDTLGGLPDSAVERLKQAQLFGSVPLKRSALYDAIGSAGQDYQNDKLVELLANKLTEV